MSRALARRLQRLEHQARARLDLDPPPTPEAQAAAVAHVRALLAQYEAPLTDAERTGWYVAPLEQRSLAERYARLVGMTMPELRQWMQTPSQPSA